MLLEADILEALRACYASAHPYRRPINIVDLGLVESICLMRDMEAPGSGIAGAPQRQNLVLTLLPSSPDEDAQAQLSAQISNRLAGIAELFRTTIHFADAPAWSPARISAEARRRLKLDPSPFHILNDG